MRRETCTSISTRNCDEALSFFSDGLRLKKSAVSTGLEQAAQKDLDGLNGRDVSEWTIVGLCIDGKCFAEHSCVMAMGVTTDGKKFILGVRKGVVETRILAMDLLSNLRNRAYQRASSLAP